MLVNGKEVALEGPCSVSDLLASLDYDSNRVAVLLNGAVLPKAAFAETLVQSEDALEVVQFVGGG